MMPGDALAAWEAYRFTRALRAVDGDRIAAELRDARSDGPLSGLLFSVKDVFPVAGVESCAGSLLLSGHVPATDPALVARLRAAGAVVFGKGVCAEFAFGVESENRLDGQVLHFADPAIHPGGSSGGDAVAVGAGIVDFAIGGDYGGSIRWPAQAAGILGLRLGVRHPLGGPRATGRIGLRPATAPAGPSGAAAPGLQSELEVAGVMARSAGLLRTVLAALADGSPELEARARSGSPHPLAGADPQVSDRPGHRGPRGRLLVSDGTEIAAVRPEVGAAMDTARVAAARAGYDLVPAPDGLRDALRDAFGVYAALRAATDKHEWVREITGGRADLLCGSTRAVLDDAERTVALAGPRQVARLRGRADEIRACVRETLAGTGTDALLLPLAASGPIGFGATAEVAGRMLTATELMAHCRAISLTGLPALSMPVRDRLSVQLVGGDGGEGTLCAIAADLGPGTWPEAS